MSEGWCLVEASSAAEVSHFVLISTDKAVNPTNPSTGSG